MLSDVEQAVRVFNKRQQITALFDEWIVLQKTDKIQDKSCLQGKRVKESIFTAKNEDTRR